MTTVPVAIVVDGRLITGTREAQLRHGVVTAPLDPYARAIATTIVRDGARLSLERAGRTLTISLGSRKASAGAVAVTLPIAPYLRAGAPIIPLAAVARALGADVSYSGAAHTLNIALRFAPLTTPTPFVSSSPQPGDRPTFTPHEVPTAAPTISGIPHPRRTPILVPPGERDATRGAP